MKRSLFLPAALLVLILGCQKAQAVTPAPTDPPATAAPTATPTATPMVIEIPFPVAAEPTEPILTPAPTPEITPQPTLEPTPSPTPEPLTQAATVLADGVGAVARLFSLGERVNVTGEQGDFYVIADEGGALLIEKRLVRLDGAAAPKAYTGYARKDTAVYANACLEGDKLQTLALNTQVTVEDVLGTVVRLTLKSGDTVYALADQISKTKISAGRGSSGGQDGGDIDLGAPWTRGLDIRRLGGVVRAGSFQPGPGTVLADGVEGYWLLFRRGDVVQVLERSVESCMILTDGRQGTLPAWLLRFEDDAPYEPWDGFARQKSVLCSDYRLLDGGKELKVNTEVRVLDELRDRYVVEVNGQLGYMLLDSVSRTKITGGGGSKGGGEWTDPVL